MNRKCQVQLPMRKVFYLHFSFLINQVSFCQTKLPVYWDKEPFSKNNFMEFFRFE